VYRKSEWWSKCIELWGKSEELWGFKVLGVGFRK